MSENEKEVYASLDPDAADATGFLDGATVTITSFKAGMFDYGGTRAAVPALVVSFFNPAVPADKQPRPENYTVGSGEHRVPSEDGKRFKVFGGKKGLAKDSKGDRLIKSIIAAGFPKDKITDDVTVFEKMVCTVRTEALPKIEGNEKAGHVLLVDKIVTLPWDNKGEVPTAAAAAPAASAPKAPAPVATGAAAPAGGSFMSDENAKASALKVISTLVQDAKHKDGVPRKSLAQLGFKLLGQDPHRQGATKLLSVEASVYLPTIDGELVVSEAGEPIGTLKYDAGKDVVIFEAAA